MYDIVALLAGHVAALLRFAADHICSFSLLVLCVAAACEWNVYK